MNTPAPLTQPFNLGNGKRRVLVVEDHPFMRRSFVEALQREPDLIVCGQAENVREALSAIESVQPDLVLTDLHLQASNGLDLIRALRVRSPSIPIVATTMFNIGRNKRLALGAGATDFVAKQDGPDRLLIAVRHALEAAHNPKDWTV